MNKEGEMSSYAIRFLMVLAAAIFIGGCGGEETAEYYGSISVTGTGTAYGDADVATIVFGVDLIEDDPGAAVDSAAVMMDDAFAAAAEMGIAESDMKTTSYSLWAEEQYDYGTYTYSGKVMYHVTHYAQVDVRNLDDVGQVLSALVGSGSNSIQGVSFRVEDSQTLMDQARTMAVADARRKAEQLATELGMEVGDATYVSEWVDYYPMSRGMVFEADAAASISAPSISPGAQSVSLSVQVTFELQQP
jgi:uncharacterized protein YggE